MGQSWFQLAYDLGRRGPTRYRARVQVGWTGLTLPVSFFFKTNIYEKYIRFLKKIKVSKPYSLASLCRLYVIFSSSSSSHNLPLLLGKTIQGLRFILCLFATVGVTTRHHYYCCWHWRDRALKRLQFCTCGGSWRMWIRVKMSMALGHMIGWVH